MKPSRCFLVKFLRLILLLLISSIFKSRTVVSFSNETDLLALLDFKIQISNDPLQIMSSWNDSIHFCNWVGVTCNPSNERATMLNLDSQNLAGSLSPSIGNLTFLSGISLKNNSFHGQIPEELGRLVHLQHLNLSRNYFSGMIPNNLSHCIDLRMLNIIYNELVGPIPNQLSTLSKLVLLTVGGGNLTGRIPPWIGNFSSLVTLALSQSNFQGSIPEELGLLPRLGFFLLYGNQLSGTIPSSIFNISSIFYFSVAQNKLSGELPENVGLTLPNLQIFAGGVNNFTGPIPISLPNASRLGLIDFAENSLTGGVLANLGSIQSLYRINLDDNKLGNGEVGDLDFLPFLANCTNLEVLGLARNFFAGELPNSIANLSTNLLRLTLGSNLIYGSVPVGIGNLLNLTLLGLEGNFFTNNVPEEIGKLQNLEALHLNVNRFSGLIPSSLGNLTSLTRLFMEENRLEGEIPPSIGNCQNLLVLNFSSNNLSGTIPKEVIGLSSLSISLSMANNSLTGSIPFEVGESINLVEIHLSDNKLSGEIPSTLGSCILLERLLMNGNLLQGEIPESMRTLRGLVEIDFSSNNFSGKIPDFLGKLSSLSKLNLSFNNFECEVSREGIFANGTGISVLGNKKLCGGAPDLHLPPCSVNNSNARRFLAPKVLITIIIVVACLIIILLCLGAFYVMRRSRNRHKTTESAESTKEWQLGISYPELVKSTNGFSDENLVGSGSFGSVYKGVLYGDEAVVAVKVLNLQQKGASKSFIDECKALKSILHRNLLKIVTACSSVDHQGNDFKALVFEFMSNGSLDQWLHPRNEEHCSAKSLTIVQRLNIAIDVASALAYLHHDCQTPIVHCDLKPSNVLLDDDMTAHVADFGLATFLFKLSNHPQKSQELSVVLKGSIGYIPPEYGMGGQVSTLGDVYSYGILLLEMFTGKRPTDEIFKDSLSIHKFVAMSLPENVMDNVDPSLFSEEEDEEEEKKIYENEGKEIEELEESAITKDYDISSNAGNIILEECLVSVMGLGLSCSNSLPRERMPMNIVVNKIHQIRDSFLRFKRRNGRKIK